MLAKKDFNERLIFGTDVFFEKLKKEIPNAKQDSPIYTELYYAVKNDIEPYLLTLTDLSNDTDDILNIIMMGLSKSLPAFVNNPDFYSMTDQEIAYIQHYLIESGVRPNDKDARLVPPEMRRQSWLDRIVNNKIYDYRRDRDKERGINPNEKIEIISTESLAEMESYKSDYNPQRDLEKFYNGQVNVNDEGIDGMIGRDPKLFQEALEHSAENEMEKRIPSELLVERLEQACSLNFKPERVLGFIYSDIIIPLSTGKINHNTRSGKPKATAKELSGKKLGNILVQMKIDLEDSLEKDLPDSIYAKLEANLNKVKKGAKERERIFNLSAAMIADASHRANEKIDKMIKKKHLETESK